jgi:hypothetical protein
MQREEHDCEGGNLADIWQSAQRRRTEDIFSWFTHFFERQRRPSDTRPQYPQRRAATSVWKTLEATRAVSRTTN